MKKTAIENLIFAENLLCRAIERLGDVHRSLEKFGGGGRKKVEAATRAAVRAHELSLALRAKGEREAKRGAPKPIAKRPHLRVAR